MNEVIKACIDFTAKAEGFSSTVYKCPAGKDTIGYGRNIEANPLNEGELLLMGFTKSTPKDELVVTKDLAKQWLEEELEKCYNQVSLLKAFDGISVRRRALLVDMCYNMGLAKLKTFKKFLKALEEKDYMKAATEMKNSTWHKQVGMRAKILNHVMICNDPLEL